MSYTPDDERRKRVVEKCRAEFKFGQNGILFSAETIFGNRLGTAMRFVPELELIRWCERTDDFASFHRVLMEVLRRKALLAAGEPSLQDAINVAKSKGAYGA